jgi:PTS system mannitol-specific IIC component
MGSSAMGATKFRNRIKDKRPDITVINTSVDNIPTDCNIAVVQTTLADRAKKSAPQAQLITIGNFLADPALDALYVQLTTGDAPAVAGENTDIILPDAGPKKQVIVADGIRLGQKPVSKEAAIQAAGDLLEKLGYVDHEYVDAMQDREKLVTTYMGMGVAIPHGTTEAKRNVKKTGIVFIQYPDGVDFGDEKAQLVFGIAGIGGEHMDLLSKLCTLLEDENLLETLKTTNDVNWVLEKLA